MHDQHPGRTPGTAGGSALLTETSLAGLPVDVTVVGADEAPVAPEVARIVTADDLAAVGPDLEPKFRICAVRLDGAGTLRVTVAETTWSQGASFHRAARRLA